MKKHKKLTLWTSVIALLVLCVLVLALGGFIRRNTQGQRPKAKAIRIQNKTDSFQVIQNDEAVTSIQSDSETEDGGIQISLRNGSDKAITAFAVSANGLIRLSDFLYNETDKKAILPHEIYTGRFGFMRLVGDNNSEQPLEFTVLGVVFDDGSSEGDPRSLWPILNGRQKCKEEVTLILSWLKRTPDSERSIDEAAVNTLKSRISSISDESAFWSGKEVALRLLDENDNPSLPQRIENLRKTLEHLLARL